ncbi:MAG: hypothetical protein KJO18_07655, partial [Acidimicrobiia bacterium]|nr:hypothetical protein [Acidimicrobiia bacterium]
TEGDAGEDSTPTSAATSDVALPVAKEPVYGGVLRYGIEADSLNPWTPQNTVPAVSGHMVLRSVFDPLALPNNDLEVKGNLLSRIEHNADYTRWTLTVRPNIVFHDGTPLDGAAVADNLERHRRSFISGNILAEVVDVEFDDMSVTVTTARPWVAFPTVLTGQVGYMASPTWLAAVDDDPTLATAPVGTGPFMFESYMPGISFSAVRNPSYWRAGLPYLDRIEFVVLRNVQERAERLESGDIDVFHTANGDEIAKWRGRLADYTLVESAEFGETQYVLLNSGNPASPLSDITVRTAMAMALDYELIETARSGGLFLDANGPFPPGTPGYLIDTGYPAHDPDAAKALVDAWESDNGDLAITFKTTTDEFNLLTAEMLESMWEAVGIDVTIEQIDQSRYIGAALVGDFEAYFWRQHSGFDPDEQLVWWSSRTVADYGSVGLNFARIADPEIDANLDIIRTSSDESERTAAAEAINERFAKQVYHLWLGWAIWGIVAQSDVQDLITGFALPNGEPVLPTGVGIGGTHQLAQIWLDR